MVSVDSLNLAIYIAVLVPWVKRQKDRFAKAASKGLVFNVILIIGGYLYLFYLKKQFRNNRVVNLFAKSMFGVFVLHSFSDIEPRLLGDFIKIQDYYNTKFFLVYIPICGICVWLICMLISIIVSYILRFINVKEKNSLVFKYCLNEVNEYECCNNGRW